MTPRVRFTPSLNIVSLPTNRPQNHAAFLHPLPNGDMLCTWFAGTLEGKSDISVLLSRLEAGSKQWSPPQQLSDDPNRSEQNPVLFLAPSGQLWLFHTAQPGGQQNKSVVRFRTSGDLGRTWSTAAQLIRDEGIFVRQPVVVMADGRWLLPIFRCRTPEGVNWTGEFDDSAVLVTANQGQHWETIKVPNSQGCVHMNIIKLNENRLVAFFRSRFADHIKISRSNDGARTWQAPENTTLPNNNSSIQATLLEDGTLAMAFNRSSVTDATGRRFSLYDDLDESEQAAPGKGYSADSKAFWGAPRSPLSLALSRDEGSTWYRIIDVAVSDGYCLSNDSAAGSNRELSYPSVVQDAQGRIHLAYTHFRQTINYVSAPRETLFASA